MKNINFKSLKHKEPIWIFILIVSLGLILVGTFEVFEFEHPKINKWMAVIGYIGYPIFYLRKFWYKNYFEWNDEVAYLRANAIFGRQFHFDDIKAVELKENQLEIQFKNRETKVFKLDNIKKSDKEKLVEIISQNSSIGESSIPF